MEFRHAFAPTGGGHAEPGRSYLVTTVTESRSPWFTDWHACRACVQEMRTLHRFGIVTSLAWVLMPEHLHWLFTLHHCPLDYVVHRFKARAAYMVNKRLRRKGQVWQHGYHGYAARRDEDLGAIARYIVANPLRRGLVRQIGDYPYWDAAWPAGEVPEIRAGEPRRMCAAS